ncbi:hypothetical protein SADUNF_Sadunf02G0121500 [Salix dunnii]|uniref:GAG-pre-integrase domain-containing protein n=1 Tax=Salix dunnii TaxID=1413687 RepID=A0A835N7G3_9ROSI|nr:hypothetical protein SADUNF_Sadunf02G0121500 [Salix dunnii]
MFGTLEMLFHQQALSHVVILYDTLLDIYNNDLSIEAYLAKIKGIADQLATINQPIPDSELVKRTLRGLPHTLEYQPFAQGIANRHTPISFTEALAIRVTFLKGLVKDNLNPILAHALFTAFRKFSYNNAIAHTAKATLYSTWHHLLGHPSSKILQQLVTDQLICTMDKFSFDVL